MLATTIQLHDIDDIEGFVCGCIERCGLGAVLGRDEHDELLAEGIAILFKLAASYEPHRPGYAQPGRFNGFAAQFLPRRLGDVWHSRHPEHHRTTDADGKRHWVYRDPPVSLNEFLESSHPGGYPAGPPQGRESHIRPPLQMTPLPRSPR